MKKIISVLVAVMLLCTLIPAVFATEATESAAFSTSVYNMAEDKEYIEKGDTVVLAIYQSGAKISGFKFTGFSYDTSALKMLGPDYDGDGWVDLWETDEVYKFAGKGVGLLAIGPGGISGGGTAKLTDRTVCYLYFEVLADKGTYSFSFSGAEADSIPASISGCSFTIGAPHTCTAGEAVKENEVAPTCEKAGSYDLVVYCTECGEEMSRETVVVEALGHAWDNGVLPETYDCDDVLKTYTCDRCDATKTEDASHDHVMAKYPVSERYTEDGSWYVTYQDKCTHADDHGCTEAGDPYEELVTGPITGDITPYIAMGVLTMVALVSAAAYMLLKRKAI